MVGGVGCLLHTLIMVAKLQNEKGQAIFEFVLFIPFILVLIAVMVTIAGAISGSINQVKSTRNYFFMTVNNNSMLPAPGLLDELKNNAIQSAGIASMGWKEQSKSDIAFAPCFKIATFIGEIPMGEACDDKIVGGDPSTFIKVKTMYGLCATTYNLKQAEPAIEITHGASAGGCVLQ